MPVDNDAIQTKMDALVAKERDFSKKERECREARIHLQAIYQEKTQVPDPTEDNPDQTKLEPVDVMDKPGGKKMNAARRQEIYDHWMAKSDTLLA